MTIEQSEESRMDADLERIHEIIDVIKLSLLGETLGVGLSTIVASTVWLFDNLELSEPGRRSIYDDIERYSKLHAEKRKENG